MTKEKQIKEMTKDLGGTWVVDLAGNPHDLSEVLMQCDIGIIAEQMHELNYRKASEVAREVSKEIMKMAEQYGAGVLFWNKMQKFALNLEKKYTEGKKDNV